MIDSSDRDVEAGMLHGRLGSQLRHMTGDLTLLFSGDGIRHSLGQIKEEGWSALVAIDVVDIPARLLFYRLASARRANTRLEVQVLFKAGNPCPSLADLFPEAGPLEAAITRGHGVDFA